MNSFKLINNKKIGAQETVPKKPSLLEKIVKCTKKMIYSENFKSQSRSKPNDFTRNRKMPFEEVILFMLMSLKCSTQTALRRFFIAMGMGITMTMKQQSFSDARKKIKIEAFIELFRLSSFTMAEECNAKWNGYKVYAIDGTKIALPTDKKLAEYFGTLGKSGTAPTAQGSILLDVLNDIVIDAAIEPLTYDERTLASWHLNILSEMVSDDKKVAVSDRGYASFELIDKYEDVGIYYVMRVKEKFNAEIDAQTTPDGYVWLEKGSRRIRVRVIKFKLESGEMETLITNIFDKRIGVKEFKELYYLRWPIETKFDIVKNKLNIEHFSTRTVDGIYQEFYATMFLTNIAAAGAHDAQIFIVEEREDKNNKYDYHANVNEAIGILKDRLVLAFIVDDPDLQAKVVENIVNEIKTVVTPYRPNRSTPRKPSRTARFYHNRRANC